jgi:hypothetical protein
MIAHQEGSGAPGTASDGRLRELDEIRLIDIYCAQDAERVANRPEQPCFLCQGTGQCAGRRHRLRRDWVAGCFFAVYPPVSHLISENNRG